jgi:hypothetical protein
MTDLIISFVLLLWWPIVLVCCPVEGKKVRKKKIQNANLPLKNIAANIRAEGKFVSRKKKKKDPHTGGSERQKCVPANNNKHTHVFANRGRGRVNCVCSQYNSFFFFQSFLRDLSPTHHPIIPSSFCEKKRWHTF